MLPVCKPSTEVVRAWWPLVTPPTWEELVSETAHPPHVADGEPNQPRVGWQAQAAREVESSFLANLRLTLSDTEGALLRSQGGPLASSPFISFPTNRTSRLEPQLLRVLFLRRLRLPLPLSARACRCGRPLRLWPSSVGLCCCWDVGTQRVPSRECGCKNLPRGRWESAN